MSHFNILAPLDFSESTTYILQAAEHIASLFEGKITPFHSYIPATEVYANDPFMMEGLANPMMPNIKEMEKNYQKQLQEVSHEHISKKLLNETKVAIGNPVTTISEEANNYDFIVMGSHGRSGFSRIFMGSVSDKILHSVHKPVLIVNREKQLKSVDNIMLTTDFSKYSKHAFPLAVDMAAKTQAKITLIHIFCYDLSNGEPDDEAISKRKQRLEVLVKQELSAIEDQLETKLIVSSGNAYEAILDESLNESYGLIIMATVGYTGIQYMMMGSTTSSVVRHVKIPVISINPKAKQNTSDEEE